MTSARPAGPHDKTVSRRPEMSGRRFFFLWVNIFAIGATRFVTAKAPRRFRPVGGSPLFSYLRPK